MQMRRKILKNDMKTYDFDVERSMKASSVESPPLMTAGPISVTVDWILSSLEPLRDMKP